MKKLKRVFGSVANLTSGHGDDQHSSDPPVSIPLSSSRKSVSGSIPGLSSDHHGSYVSYENQSLDSYNSTFSADVDPYSKNDKTFTKLHKWAYLGDVVKLKKFIKKVPVDAQDSEGKTALHHAAAQGRGDALLFLLGSKGNVETKDNAGMTPYLRAVERCQMPIVQMLLQRRVDLQVTDYQGNSSSHLAAKAGATDLLTLLLDCGGDCDAQNSLGRTPLHLACGEIQQDTVETLLRHGASVNVTDREGVTPLMIAAKVGSAPLVETLLEQGADVSPIDASKWSAADYARFTNHNQLHHRLSSLMEEGGSSGLFSNDLLNVSDEGSSQDEGAVGISPKDKQSDNEVAVDSWSDNSEVNSVKEKPKLNLAKFLPSSDESADNVFSSIPEQTSNVLGPPKPPRLYTSSSSLASGAVDEKEEDIVSDKNESDGKKDEMKSLNVSDSWKSSSEDEPQLEAFSLLRRRSGTLEDTREKSESLKKNFDVESQSRVKKGDLLAELGLDNIEFHSSEEEVSFGEDDSMLPIGESPKEVTKSRRNSQAIINGNNVKESNIFVESVDQCDSRTLASPLHSSRSSNAANKTPRQSPLKVKESAKLGSPVQVSSSSSSSSSEGSRNRTPLKLSPRKSPSRRSPKKTKSKERKLSIYDSDTDEELKTPQRPVRRKSTTPIKKKKEGVSVKEFDSDSSDGENHKKELSQKLPTTKISPVNSVIKEAAQSPLKEMLDSNKGKTKTTELLGKLSDSSGNVSGENKLSLFAVNSGRSRTSTLSTVVGTLGREGTMQEMEEMWEANPSISPKRSSSSSSVQNSEEHPKSVSDELSKPLSESLIRKPNQELSKEATNGEKYISKVQGNEEMCKVEREHEGDHPQDISDNDIDADLLDYSQNALTLSPNKPLVSPEPKDSEINTTTSKVNKKKSSFSQDDTLSLEGKKVQNVLKENIENNRGSELDKGTRMSHKNFDSSIAKGHSIHSASLSRRGSRTGTGRTSGFGSIVFSDEDSMTQDPLLSPRFMEEMDDGISAASTETEESTHINSGLKDSLLTPLSSLPDAADVGQLQDLVRELRLKLEKEFGRRAAIETRYSHLQQQEKHARLQNDQLEQDAQRLQQEISSLTSRIKRLEYSSHIEQDSSRLKDQSLEGYQQHCAQLEEQCSSLRTHALQQEQLVDSLMVQLQTKECVIQTLQGRLEEMTSQTKYVSMKSCQTEEVFVEAQIENKPKDSVDVSVQTLDIEVVATGFQTSNNDTDFGEEKKDSECQHCHTLKAQTLCETNVASTQTELESKCKVNPSAHIDVGTQSEKKSDHNVLSIGIQCVPERVMKLCQTQNNIQSHHSQTDMTSSNCDVIQRKIVSDSSCQVSFATRVAAVQTDDFVLPVDSKFSDSSDSKKINTSEVTSALEPVLQNFSQDVKTLIIEAVEANQNSLQELMYQFITNQMKDWKGSMEDSLQQKSVQQSQEAELKFNEWTRHLEEILQGQSDVVNELCNTTAATKNADINDMLSQVNNNLESRFQCLRSEVEELQKLQGRNEEKITSHMENVIKDMRDSSGKITQCLADFHKENKDSGLETYNKLSQLTVPQFNELHKAIQALSNSDDSGLYEAQTRSVISRLDSLEKSFVSSFEKSPTSQDLCAIEEELRKINNGIQKKLTVLQHSIQTADAEGKIDQDILDSYMVTLRENNKQLLHVFKTKTSESTININEVLEENFHILQDHLRKVQQTLVQRINEVSQHANVAEDQKMSWITKQVTEMTSQVSGMQTNLLRMQSSLEAAQSLPSAGGIIDEALISSLRATNEQAVTSLKFQNQSVIQLLEALQKEMHDSIQKAPTSKDRAEIQLLKETLNNKEEELRRLNSMLESLQEKLKEQSLNLERSQRKEEGQRQEIGTLSEKLRYLERDLRERDEKLSHEKMKITNQSEDVSKIRQENFRLSSENSKLSSMLNSEQQQRHIYENEIRSQQDARDIAEAKVQEVVAQLQITQQQMSLQRTPPTGRDNDEDNILLKQQEIKKLEAEKKEIERLCNEHSNRAQRLEIQLKEIEADLGLERGCKEDLEKQLKKSKDTITKLQKDLSEASVEHGALQELYSCKEELESELKSNEMAMDIYRKKVEAMNKEKLQLKQDIMLLKGEKLSFELIKQERDLAEEMQKKLEAQLQLMQRKISEDYVPKSRLNNLHKEVENKYQLELSAKLSALNHLMEEQNQHQESQAKVKDTREQGLKSELGRLSEEVIRLRAMLSAREEEEDTWKVRHDRLMDLYQQQAQTQRSMHKASHPKKPSEESLAINLREINAHLQTPFATSTLLGQLTPPASLQLPKTPSNIDSYHFTHSDSFDRTLQKYLKSASNDHSRYLSLSDDKPHARISPMQPSHLLLHDTLPTLDKSCEDYVDLLKKKYGL